MVRLKLPHGRSSSLARGQQGAAMILTAAALFGLLAVASLVIDFGNAYQRSRTAQSVADASALAGAWDLITDTATSKAVAAAYVADNLDTTLPFASSCVADADVTAETTCYTIGTRIVQITSPWDGSDYLVRVDVCDAVSTSFARLIGFDTLTVCRFAIGQVEEPRPATPGGPAIQTFSPDAKKSFETTGGGTIWTDGDIFIASTSAGDAFVAAGTGGVTMAGGTAWYDHRGGCADPPGCGGGGGAGGFIPSTSLVACDLTSIDPTVDDCPGGADFFDDVYANHPINSIVWSELATCLNDDFAALGQNCGFYDPGAGYPTHSVHSEVKTEGPVKVGDVATTCGGGTFEANHATMLPGHYSTTGRYTIKGCVKMEPGIYLFDGGFRMAAGWVQGNDVLLINGTELKVSDIAKSKACLTSLKGGTFANFLYYQHPANANTFDIQSDSILTLQGIIYAPGAEIRIQGADASTIGGDGSAECLGVKVVGGGSIVGTKVLVKSDGTLSIHAFAGTPASGGGTWVRLYK